MDEKPQLKTSFEQVTINSWTEDNHKEVADEIRKNSIGFSQKLLMSPLVGSGVAILAIFSILGNPTTEASIKKLLVFSLWWFFLSLAFSFITAVLVRGRMEAESKKQIELSNKQNYEKAIYDARCRVRYFLQLDNVTREMIENQRYMILKHKHMATSCLIVENKIRKLSSHTLLLSLLFFMLGILVPLISVSLYDYF